MTITGVLRGILGVETRTQMGLRNLQATYHVVASWQSATVLPATKKVPGSPREHQAYKLSVIQWKHRRSHTIVWLKLSSVNALVLYPV